MLGFSLSFLRGSGLLVLEPRNFEEAAVRLEQLELLIPRLQFPFDATGGPQRFQHRRCSLYAAKIVCQEQSAQSWLGRNRGGELEITALRFQAGAVTVAGFRQISERPAGFAADATLTPAGGTRLRVDFRPLLGFDGPRSGVAPLSVALFRKTGLPLWKTELDSDTRLVCDPLAMLLFRLLPGSGWRLPDLHSACVKSVSVENGRLEIVYGPRSAD